MTVLTVSWSTMLATVQEVVFSRLVRFGMSGGICGAIQILLLGQLEFAGWNPAFANAAATAASVQFNFVLNHWFVWGDRQAADIKLLSSLKLWIKFHGSVA